MPRRPLDYYRAQFPTPRAQFRMRRAAYKPPVDTTIANAPAAEEVPAFTAYDWTANTNNTGFTPSDGTMAIYFLAKYWAWGGWNPGQFAGGVDTTNRVLSSLDATTWTEALAHSASPPTSGPGARPKRRHWFGLVEYTHNSIPYVYLLGGDHESPSDDDFADSDGVQCDGWRTTDPGDENSYERVLASGDSPWAPRLLVVFGASPGKLWAFGGVADLSGTPTASNQLLCSTDGGFTWFEVWAHDAGAANRPSPRGIISKLVYWRGRMWIVGGGTYNDNAALRDYCRDVWSFDPNNPNDVTEHETPAWLGRQYHSVEIFNDRLTVIGGFSHSINTREVWSSGDGDRWLRHPTPSWPPSHADGTCVNGDTLVHVAGNGDISVGTMHAHTLVATDYAETPAVVAPLAVWDIANSALTGTNITSVPDDGGTTGVALEPSVAGDAIYSSSNAVFGGAPSAATNGGHFLHTASAVDLSSFEIDIVAKAAPNDGVFYFAYAILPTPTRYVYFATNRTGQDDNETTLSMDILRGGVNTSGSAAGVVDVEDFFHVYTLRYDGTAAGSGIYIDNAKSLPDTGSLTGNAGTGAFTAPIYFFSDNTGTNGAGAKAAEIAEIRLYPLRTALERQVCHREYFEKFAYAYP